MTARRTVLTVAVLLVAGCAGTARVAPEAEPFVAESTQSVVGLANYLAATGADVHEVCVRFPEGPGRRRWKEFGIAASGIIFMGNGSCDVTQYETVQNARLFSHTVYSSGNRLGRGFLTLRGGPFGGGTTASGAVQRPGYFLGRLLVGCSGLRSQEFHAVEALQEAVPLRDRPTDSVLAARIDALPGGGAEAFQDTLRAASDSPLLRCVRTGPAVFPLLAPAPTDSTALRASLRTR